MLKKRPKSSVVRYSKRVTPLDPLENVLETKTSPSYITLKISFKNVQPLREPLLISGR